VQPAVLSDVLDIEARGFRAVDEHECWLLARESCAKQCFRALRTLDAETYSVMCDGVAVGMFGVSPLIGIGIPDGWGIAWMLGSDGFLDIRHDFLKYGPLWFDHVQRYRRTVVNMIHVDNAVALAWAEAIGFELTGPVPQGEDGEFFYTAIRRMDPQ
jgi:hypothetical protein